MVPPTDRCGTPEYVAPEVISAPHYDPKVDCYSLGVILFELLSKFKPTQFSEQRRKLEVIRTAARQGVFKKHKHWKNVSMEAIDLIL